MMTDYSYLKIKQTININEQSDVESSVGSPAFSGEA